MYCLLKCQETFSLAGENVIDVIFREFIVNWLRTDIAFVWCFYFVAHDVSVNVLHGHKFISPKSTLTLRFALFLKLNTR